MKVTRGHRCPRQLETKEIVTKLANMKPDSLFEKDKNDTKNVAVKADQSTDNVVAADSSFVVVIALISPMVTEFGRIKKKERLSVVYRVEKTKSYVMKEIKIGRLRKPTKRLCLILSY